MHLPPPTNTSRTRPSPSSSNATGPSLDESCTRLCRFTKLWNWRSNWDTRTWFMRGRPIQVMVRIGSEVSAAATEAAGPDVLNALEEGLCGECECAQEKDLDRGNSGSQLQTNPKRATKAHINLTCTSISRTSTSPLQRHQHHSNLSQTGRVKTRKRGVDELLQLKLRQVIADMNTPPLGSTIGFTTGDGIVGSLVRNAS